MSTTSMTMHSYRSVPSHRGWLPRLDHVLQRDVYRLKQAYCGSESMFRAVDTRKHTKQTIDRGENLNVLLYERAAKFKDGRSQTPPICSS